MSGYPIIFGEGVDPDAYQYFLRAGIASGTQTPSSYDDAASFNGTNQFLSIPSNSTLQIGGQAFSFSVWFNASNVSGTKYLIGKSAFSLLEYGLCVNGATIQMLLANNASGWVIVAQSATPVTANTWNHAVFTYNGTTATIYLNGASVGNASGSITTSGTGEFGIGVSPGYSQNWAGSISSVGFWKRALTASEVSQLWNNGAGRTYASLDTGLRNNLVSWWALNQNSVTADSHGTNTLTNNGTPLVTAPNIGPIITGYSDSRRLISDFVRGIKSLGLWNSMVCWPLRASQNAGGGITAFSLGGLGAFDGNLINGPAWGSSGINFNKTATQFIGTNLNPNLTNNGIFVCSDWSQISSSEIQITAIGNRDIYGSGGRGASLGVTNASNLRAISSPDGTTINSFQITPLPTGFGCHSMLSNGSVLTVNQNNTQVATQTIVSGTTQTSLNIGSALSAQYTYKGVIPFAAAFYAPVSNTAIYNLYKSTLGLGLGLP
jgi:hypothetical protein